MEKSDLYLNRFREEKNLDNIIYSANRKKLMQVPPQYFNENDTFVIPKEVEVITSLAFENCNKLRKIRIPSTVKLVRDYAFLNCENLNEVIFSKFTEIQPNAFKNCNLRKIYFLGTDDDWKGVDIIRTTNPIIMTYDKFINAIDTKKH